MWLNYSTEWGSRMANKTKWTGPIGNPGAPGYTGPDHTWQARYKARLDELAREAAIRREGLQKIVDDATLDKLVKVFLVPQEKRGVFYRSVRRAIIELQRGMKAKHPQPRQTPIMKALNKYYQNAADKIRELLSSDCAAPSGDHEYARSFMLAFLRGEDDNVKGTDEVVADGVAFLDNLDCAFEKARTEIKKAFKDKGRPPGAKNGQGAIDVAIDLFIHQLIFSIKEAGGHIATSRRQESSPAYAKKAVEILRPFLPDNFPATKLLARKFETIGTKIARSL